MSAKAIYESDAKRIIRDHIKQLGDHVHVVAPKFVDIDANVDLNNIPDKEPWVLTTKLVAKPDQLIKRRGKLGLLHVNADWPSVVSWIDERRNRQTSIGKVSGALRHFIVEPFVPHQPNEELYLAIYSHRNGDTILFHHEGGIDIGDVDTKATRLEVAIGETPARDEIKTHLLLHAPKDLQDKLSHFILGLYSSIYVDLHFTYLEINPLVMTHADKKIYILDLAAKLDQAAEYLVKTKWGNVQFPPPFGRDSYPEEDYIADLDAKSGASMKLTVMNKAGRIWTMVAGGGASVIYADTICDFGYSHELANYGEYSGAPTEGQTYEYAKIICSLMTDGPVHPEGKVLIIGGSIANFTNVASTFKGIVRALTEYKQKFTEHRVAVYVRRGGPNYQEGLRYIKDMGATINIPTYVFGPETHMTAVVAYALKLREIPEPEQPTTMTANFLLEVGGTAGGGGRGGTSFSRSTSQMPTGLAGAASKSDLLAQSKSVVESSAATQTVPAANTSSPSHVLNNLKTSLVSGVEKLLHKIEISPSADTTSSNNTISAAAIAAKSSKPLFTATTKSIIWGMQPRAVQSMLDFDFVCSRKEPSVVCMVYPLVGDHKQKFYWGHKEILLPVFKDMAVAMKKYPDVDCVVNFASLRSAYESTVEVMQFAQIRSIAIIAEGIPENLTRKMMRMAHEKGIVIIGPATVGGIKPGCLKIGNTGGMLDNILASRLYRPGSVAYVSRSGGMSNELNNIISRTADGVQEGVAIGGDRYPCSTFLDHILRYERADDVKMIVMLGELGGIEEYHVIEAMQRGEITKPIVAWCIGTCATMFATDVQFGHAGAAANSERETALAKNAALVAAGATVPQNFDQLGDSIALVYDRLLETGVILPLKEAPPPTVPMDYAWARELGLIRKPASFMTSICDERGQELLYAGVPVTDIIREDLGVGGVIALLWFQRRLPRYATKFFEMCLMVTADHGPAVSGAHNTIVTARAGKDLVSSLTSGLLTIGDRFGGALDASARQFSEALDTGLSPNDFVNKTRKEGKLIMGIGHRVKSINNPDRRVEILKQYIHANFTQTTMLDYALEVEKITTRKKPNLILNIDGLIATAFVDFLRYSGCFSVEEATEYLEIGVLNGLFVVGRSIGFIGHYLDQRRLKQGLYRHPWDDISYIMPELSAEAQGRSSD